MDSFKRSLSRALAKFFRAQPTTGDEKLRKDQSKNPQINEEEQEDNGVRRAAIDEALIAKTFACILSIKAAYSQIQFSESPFDAEGIQSSDEIIVSEMHNLSEIKQSFYYQNMNEPPPPPETTLALSEVKEHKCLVKMHEINLKKLDSELKLKDSEIISLKRKLVQLNEENASIERNLSSSGQLQISDNTLLNARNPTTHFIACLNRALRSITAFAGLLTSEMESAKWDLNAVADAIEPGISFQKQNRKFYAFESFVCRVMLDGFNFRNFSIEAEKTEKRGPFFRKPGCGFATFCREKYSKLVHEKMESSLFGNLKQRRSLMDSNEVPDTTPFLTSFVKMAKRVWLLHSLAISLEPEVSIFRLSKGARFSEAYMESLNDEAFVSSSERDPRVAFVVVPGFEVLNTIIQCKVYLH